MDFIVAASNLRAANYDIPPADRHKVILHLKKAKHVTGLASTGVTSNRLVISLHQFIAVHFAIAHALINLQCNRLPVCDFLGKCSQSNNLELTHNLEVKKDQMHGNSSY